MENKNMSIIKKERSENDFHCHLDMKQFAENAGAIILMIFLKKVQAIL